ncbi:hypothetical protein [Elioraea rosea]|uniref:hypothetical protein n=1 Tax=Elioraea rosea TaxID=2492390 RepID=UPI00118229E8|nr:hypothetical protein [Elioraea rosea]
MSAVFALSAAWLVWAAAFAALYALHGLGCAIGADERSVGPLTQLQVMMGVVWIAALAGSAGIVLALWRGAEAAPGGVPRRLLRASWMAALLAIFITGLPLTFPSACV